jgi:hypothetical protein
MDGGVCGIAASISALAFAGENSGDLRKSSTRGWS